MAKLNDRCFCYFTAAMLVPSAWAPTWRLHTKFYKFSGWNTFPNNARMNYRTDLNLGEVVCISLIFHVLVSWLNLLNGYNFYFWWRDTANQPYAVRGRTKILYERFLNIQSSISVKSNDIYRSQCIDYWSVCVVHKRPAFFENSSEESANKNQ